MAANSPPRLVLGALTLILAGWSVGCTDTETGGGPTDTGEPRPSPETDTEPSGLDADADQAADDSGQETGDDTDMGDEAGSDSGDPPKPAPEYPLTDQPYTSLQKVWAPKDPSASTTRAILDDKLEITDINAYEMYGLGVEEQPGQPWQVHNDFAPGWAGPKPNQRRSLLYFWQSADPQLVDEESPIRFEGVTKAPVGSTYRPGDHLTTQVYESHVRTARRISDISGRPFDFAFISGDFTDGGQLNEVEWAFQILTGGVVDPDSGADDDPVPGPGNDFADPFWSPGIGVPFYMAVGNHETLYTGTLAATSAVQQAAVGNEVFDFTGEIPGVDNLEGIDNGFRDASTKTAEVRTSGTTPADPDRRIVGLAELLELIHGAGGEPDGHGLDLSDALDGIGYFSVKPLPGKPIRLIVLNTLMNQPAHASGGIGPDQYDWLETELDRARSADELVIVGGHHRLEDFTRLSSVDGGQVKDLLASYDNVLLYLVGHGHSNAMRKVESSKGLGFWELMCASTVDYPQQTRILELVYEGNDYLSVYVTNLGQNAPPGSPAARGRALTAARKVFMWGQVRDKWRDQHAASNLLLRYELPADLAASIEEEQWPERVESLETLQRLSE